jgi:Ca2+-binding EF-hand superfamily protein
MKAHPFQSSALATLAVVTVLTGSAFARRGEDDNGGGGDDDNPTTDTAKFEAADADSSGGLNLAEFTNTFSSGTRASKILEKFNKADTGNDDSVSLAEWLFFKDDTIPETEKDDILKFNAADNDASGSLTYDEFATTLAGKKSAVEIRARFLRADTDGDDFVSLAEWGVYKNDNLPDDSNKRPRAFDLADLDTSGDITPDEFAGFFKPKTKLSAIQKKFDKYDRNDDSVLTRDEWNPGKRGNS